ncbi:chromosome segregation ATPases [Candidatus Vecturithrix granuli]|uniref:Chromosome segregation ATPases n=1 Tax=Vecturithrix granuli TaxID=1499967 RepID=A0A081BV20_VECG1|nr:chromosome segregation ATPases [Candidatus Vecturithrix granuli]
MNEHTPQHSRGDQKKHALEEKLRDHIQREFSLGEKVISLLKQKKELEANLQQQQQQRDLLERNLEEILKGKEAFEQKFLAIQQELQEQQQRLRSRSHLILENEENSRHTLKELRQKIALLEKQLGAVDQQKVETQKRLLHQIRHLRQKEREQSQQLHKTSRQRDVIEKRLHELAQNYQHLSQSYQQEKQEHERQLDLLFREQVHQESQVEQLLEQYKQNEEKLQQEITELKISKTQLEDQLAHMKQQAILVSKEQEADLLRVVEKQQIYIEEFREKAHQRSTILRTENETLRKEMESMLDSQEKMKWENQMLETSLKGLQADLAEYIQLQKRFEEVQREKETFEEKFHRKIQFLQEPHEEAEQALSAQELPESQSKLPVEEQRQNGQKSKKRVLPDTDKEKRSFKSRLLQWFSFSHDKLLNTIMVIIALILAIQILCLIPWQYLGLSFHSRREEVKITPQAQLSRLGDQPEESIVFAPVETEAEKTDPMPVVREKRQTMLAKTNGDGGAGEDSTLALPSIASEKTRSPDTPPTPRPLEQTPFTRPRPTNIIVKLLPEQIHRFPPQTTMPLPTSENNSILRRYYKQKSASSNL